MRLKSNQTDTENKLMVTKLAEGINLEFAIKIYTLLYIKYITNKDLLYSTWNYVQCLIIIYNGDSKRDTDVQISLMDSVGEGEDGEIWENGIETCIISCTKRVVSPGLMHDTGCSGLVHWDDPE